MGKKKESSRNNITDKIRQPLVSQKIEALALSLAKQLSNIPNVPMLRVFSDRLATELLECIAASNYAYSTLDYKLRLEYLLAIEVHLRVAKSAFNLIYGYSFKPGAPKIMNEKQFAQYLIDLDEIETQRLRWAEATVRSIKGESKF